jgi:hypothetical protein
MSGAGAGAACGFLAVLITVTLTYAARAPGDAAVDGLLAGPTSQRRASPPSRYPSSWATRCAARPPSAFWVLPSSLLVIEADYTFNSTCVACGAGKFLDTSGMCMLTHTACCSCEKASRHLRENETTGVLNRAACLPCAARCAMARSGLSTA